jgi:enoyl-CoA hydratase/carnithine racemase
MYSAEEALGMGLIDGIVAEEELRTAAIGEARRYAAHYGAAFEAIKKLLRSPCAETMRAVDERYRAEMVEIWYSPETWERLKNIKIH